MGWRRNVARMSVVVMCAADLVIVINTSIKIEPVIAASFGNTDQFESTDYPPGFPPSQQSCITSPIWSGTSCVQQRYGCTSFGLEDAVTTNSPPYERVCLQLDSSWWHWHHGIDLGTPAIVKGTYLYSSVSGKVVQNDTGLLGIDDLSGHVVYYVHGDSLTSLNTLVTVGQHIVNANCYGSCTGPHLHLEVHSTLRFNQANGSIDDINPEPWLQYQGPHPATVSWGTNRLDFFIRGTDGNVYHKWTSDDTNWNPTGQGNYDPLGSAGGGLAGQVAAASWGPNRIDLFGVGYDGNLWHKWYDSGTWYGWENLSSIVPLGIPSLIGSPSAVSYASSALSVFVRASNGSIVHVFYANAPWNWESHAGYSTTDPVAIAGPNRIDLVVYGRSLDSTVASGYSWHQSWTPAGGWSPGTTGYDNWGTADSRFVSQPGEAFFSATNIDTLAVSAQGHLWDNHFDGTSWTGWQQMVGSSGPSGVIGSPSATDTPYGGLFSLLVRGSDGALWDCWPSGTTCAWKAHGGQITNDPLVVSAASWQEDVLVRAASPFYVAHQLYANSS